MVLKIDIDDGEVLEALKEVIINRQVIREAMTKAVSQARVVEELSRGIAGKITTQVNAVLDSPELAESLKKMITETITSVMTQSIEKKTREQARQTR